MNSSNALKTLDMKKINTKLSYLLVAVLCLSCTRDEEVLPAATFPNTAEIFTDVPVSLTDQFFRSFDPNVGANTNGFGTDDNVAYEGTTSIRIDVPSSTDEDGTFIGGIFEDRGAGRNLTEYNALTFWAKATTTATVGLFGFGVDFGDNEFAASLTDVPLTTGWKKIIIPIPDPSRLVQETGMFIFSAGSSSTGGAGYTFWMDELKFENLPEVAQPQPQILNGADETVSGFNGVTIPLSGLNVTYSVDGREVAVDAAPAYFDFTSTDGQVASVSDDGIVTLNRLGSATITGKVGELDAQGSLTATSTGDFDFAPTPPARDPGDVVSIFSDAYTNLPVTNYNGFFNYATTQGGAIDILGDNIISYTDLNFVSINVFDASTVDASAMTHVHLDVFVREAVDPGDFINFQLINNNGPSETSASVGLGNYSPLLEEQWVSYDIPLSDFGALGTPNDIDLIFFVSDATISSIYVDNVYFYRN